MDISTRKLMAGRINAEKSELKKVEQNNGNTGDIKKGCMKLFDYMVF